MHAPLFLSHGAPTLPFEDVAARHFLEGLAPTMVRPRAILMVSAHWETRVPTVNAVASNETIHEFRGFPKALYRLRYSAAGAPSSRNSYLRGAAHLCMTLRRVKPDCQTCVRGLVCAH